LERALLAAVVHSAPVTRDPVVAEMDYVIRDCWTMISQDLVDTAIDQFSKRLTLVIRAQGGHIEHRLS